MFVIHLMIPIFLTDPYQNLDRSQSKLRQISCPLPNKFNEKKTVSDPRCKQTFGDWYFQFFITFHIINVMRTLPSQEVTVWVWHCRHEPREKRENVFLEGWSSCHKLRKVSNEMYKMGLAKMQNWEDRWFPVISLLC